MICFLAATSMVSVDLTNFSGLAMFSDVTLEYFLGSLNILDMKQNGFFLMADT